jgi:hypothetical protein
MNWTRVAERKSPGATGCVASLHFLLYAARIGTVPVWGGGGTV